MKSKIKKIVSLFLVLIVFAGLNLCTVEKVNAATVKKYYNISELPKEGLDAFVTQLQNYSVLRLSKYDGVYCYKIPVIDSNTKKCKAIYYLAENALNKQMKTSFRKCEKSLQLAMNQGNFTDINDSYYAFQSVLSYKNYYTLRLTKVNLSLQTEESDRIILSSNIENNLLFSYDSYNKIIQVSNRTNNGLKVKPCLGLIQYYTSNGSYINNIVSKVKGDGTIGHKLKVALETVVLFKSIKGYIQEDDVIGAINEIFNFDYTGFTQELKASIKAKKDYEHKEICIYKWKETSPLYLTKKDHSFKIEFSLSNRLMNDYGKVMNSYSITASLNTVYA